MAQVLTQTREVMFAQASILDVVHVAKEIGPRWFKTLCCPDTTFWGELATTIPAKQKRCETCARKAKEAANAANKST
jgi:hypothetical protein